MDKAKSTNYKRKFNADNYDRVELTVKKGTKELLRKEAQICGESLNEFIKKATRDRYYNESGEDIDL